MFGNLIPFIACYDRRRVASVGEKPLGGDANHIREIIKLNAPSKSKMGLLSEEICSINQNGDHKKITIPESSSDKQSAIIGGTWK